MNAVILHGRELIQPNIIDILTERGVPDLIFLDVFSNAGLKLRKERDRFLGLSTRFAIYAPCFFVRGDDVANKINEFAQLFDADTVMLNVMVSVNQNKIDDYAEDFLDNLDPSTHLIVAGQSDMFGKHGTATHLLKRVTERKNNYSSCVVTSDSIHSLNYVKSIKDNTHNLCISPIMLEGHVKKLHELNVPIIYWNLADLVFETHVKTEEEPKPSKKYIALKDRLSVYKKCDLSATIVAKVQSGEYVHIDDIIEQSKYGIVWGRDIEGNYVILYQNNSENFKEV